MNKTAARLQRFIKVKGRIKKETMDRLLASGLVIIFAKEDCVPQTKGSGLCSTIALKIV
jgi:hypothetical protein